MCYQDKQIDDSISIDSLVYTNLHIIKNLLNLTDYNIEYLEGDMESNEKVITKSFIKAKIYFEEGLDDMSRFDEVYILHAHKLVYDEINKEIFKDEITECLFYYMLALIVKLLPEYEVNRFCI